MSRNRKNNKLAKQVREVILTEHAPILADISFRLGQLHETAGRQLGLGNGTVYAEDLNTSQHQITGYTLTNNAPSAGSISWVDVHIVYNGEDYAITNGNTALKYVYFTLATTPTTLKFSATKPALAEGDILLFVNEGGVARNMLSQTNQTMPRLVATNAIDSDAIAPNAVISESIAGNAVGSTKIADGAIARSAQIGGKIVGTGQMTANAVDSTILANNAVTGDKILANAVGSTKIADGAIARAAQIGGKIVGTGQLATNAVDSTILAAGAIDNANKFGTGKIIPGTQIVDQSVGTTALGQGAVSPSKLNILQHVLY